MATVVQSVRPARVASDGTTALLGKALTEDEQRQSLDAITRYGFRSVATLHKRYAPYTAFIEVQPPDGEPITYAAQIRVEDAGEKGKP